MTAKIEIYVSTDIETDGPIPGPHSMLSFASAAYTPQKTLISTFAANLVELPGASGHPKTMDWWKQQSDAWEACRKNPQAPDLVMKQYRDWLMLLPGTPIFVGYPVAFDFMFVYWYLIKFTGESPFSHSAVDIKTYSMALLKKGYRDSSKRNMPAEWFDDLPHSHVALDNALEQGAIFCNMLSTNKVVENVPI